MEFTEVVPMLYGGGNARGAKSFIINLINGGKNGD